MSYSYIIIPIIVAISSQAIKLLTDGIKGNFNIKNIFSTYGGFPSSHTAFAVSLTTLIGINFGASAPIFAIALIFTLIIMRDAISFRGFLGRQAQLFNRVIDTLPKEKNIPKFQERIGHSLFEVIGGAVYGIGLTYLLNLL